MHAPSIIAVTESSQVGEARRAAVRLAESAGAGETQRGEVAIVATELANNLVRHGGGGRLLLRTFPGAAGPTVELLAVDTGPGMVDIQRCLADGFSTGGTSGTGLGAVRRLSTEFDLYSRPGAGTVVMARIGVRTRGMPAAAEAEPFQWAAISVPAPHEVVCGDAWRVLRVDADIAIIVADGLGHGPLAAEASEAAARLFEGQFLDGPGAFIESAHRVIGGTRGAAVAVASMSASRAGAKLRYAGVGNIAGTLLSLDGASRGLFSHNGTVGHQVRKIQEFDYPWTDGGLLVMHSDGLQTRWDLKDYPGVQMRHPAVIAAVLYRDFLRGRDDVTIVVIRMTRRPTSL